MIGCFFTVASAASRSGYPRRDAPIVAPERRTTKGSSSSRHALLVMGLARRTPTGPVAVVRDERGVGRRLCFLYVPFGVVATPRRNRLVGVRMCQTPEIRGRPPSRPLRGLVSERSRRWPRRGWTKYWGPGQGEEGTLGNRRVR
jgi:hypothetical protein